MLRIEQIESYRLPRYPRVLYYEPPDTSSWKIAGSIASVALLALLVSSCNSAGVTGPPPMPPTMVTEREARTVIDKVFVKNGINLEADVPFSFFSGDQKQFNLKLDGFNKDLNIGYEYIINDDRYSFYPEVIESLEKACQSDDSGPYIKTIEGQGFYRGSDEAYEKLETIIQGFIDDLRSRGII